MAEGQLSNRGAESILWESQNKKATAMVAFVFTVLRLEVDLYFKSSKLDGVIWQVFAENRSDGPILGLVDLLRTSAP